MTFLFRALFGKIRSEREREREKKKKRKEKRKKEKKKRKKEREQKPTNQQTNHRFQALVVKFHQISGGLGLPP